MKIFFRIALISVLLAALPLRSTSHSLAQSSSHFVPLSKSERKIVLTASRLGLRNPHQAQRWLHEQGAVGSVSVGADHVTVDVTFRTGAEAVLFSRDNRATERVQVPHFSRAAQTRAPAGARALVLEPFADQLGLGEGAGSGEIAPLTAAGFSVDVLRNGAVTVGALENMAKYSVVYMETHAGVLGDGDAIVLTRQTDASSVKSLFADGSVTQGIAYGDQNLYIAIKAQFVLKHVGTFPNSSILFLNGCELLNANVLWDAFRQHHVSTMISWDDKVINTLDEAAADFMFPRLAAGDTIATNVQAAKDAHLGVSTFDNVDAHLGFLGEGDNTLANALNGTLLPTSTPTATATSTITPTSTPTATSTPRTLKPCKRKTYHRVHGTCVPKKKAKKKSPL